MKRVSFIDLGSNSVRFVIIEINDNGSYQLIYQQKESIRLSENMWEKIVSLRKPLNVLF